MTLWDLRDIVLQGPLLVAVAIAVTAGAVSFFSPCCLPLVPGYLSYVSGLAGEEPAAARSREDGPTGGGTPDASGVTVEAPPRAPSRGRLVLGTLLFVGGFAVVFTSYGVLFGSLGGLLLEHQDTLLRVLGVVTILLGLQFAGVLWRLPLAGRTFKPRWRPRTGLLGAPLLGITFGIGWTPCIGPTLAAVLTLATSTADATRGAGLSFAYSMGLGIPFLLAALSVGSLVDRNGWARRHTRTAARVGGWFLVLLGALQVTGVWGMLMATLQSYVAGWTVPL